VPDQLLDLDAAIPERAAFTIRLRDLGFDRSEIASVAAEVSGTAERTRVRVLLMSHNSP